MGGYLLLNVGLAFWMYRDGTRRIYPIVPWCIAAIPLGWLMLPIYLAKRPLRDGEVREGGTAWNVLKNFCLFWTVTMLMAAVAGMASTSSMPEATSDAEKAGRAIGTTIGLGMIFALWFFPLVGAALLGVFLKKSSIVERGPTGALAAMAEMTDGVDASKTHEDGVLGKARRMANQVGDYARSDEARAKLDAVKGQAAKVGGMASEGAKKIAEGTRQAAVQAREKADEFSKSETVQMAKAKAKEDWDEIRGGNFRGSKLTDSPLVVGLAIFLFFPVGLFLLWKHPVLGRNKAWWWAGGIWGLVVFASVINGNKGKKPASDEASVPQVVSADSPRAKKAEQRPAPADAAETDDESGPDETPTTKDKKPARTAKPKKVKKGINLENYERITDGMAREDVEAMLGKGRELASAGDEKAIAYETSNFLTGSGKLIEVHYLDGRVTVKFKDGF